MMNLFVVLLIVVIIASFGLVTSEFHEDRLQDNYVPVNEAVLELQFSVYTREEWQNFFADYKETYITRQMVYDILTQL